MTRRRDLLKAAGAATAVIGTAGCFSRFLGGGDEDESSESPQETADAEQANSSAQDAQEENATGDASEDRERNETDGADERNETGNESDQESEEEKPIAPDENETEIDRDQYNESEPAETEERPQSDIESSVDDVERRNGRVSVTVTVRNVSSQAIDIVDVEVLFYSENGRYLDSRIETITDLEAGTSESVEIAVRAETIRGDPAEIELEATPMDRVN